MMLRLIVAIAVATSVACTLKFPDKHEGTFACEKDSDCNSPFICKGNVCVDLNGAARCNPPTVTAAANPATAQYVGFSYALSGSATSADPTCPIGNDTAWLVCDAPAGSKFAATDGTNCTHLADGDTATFTPDVRGTYNLTLRATAGDASGDGVVPLTVLADALFVEMTFSDARTMLELVHSNVSSGCYDFDQTTCASHPECAFDATFATCWTNCAALSQVDCDNAPKGHCSYDGGTSTCDSALDQQTACIVRTTAAGCASLANCIFAKAGFCHADCTKLVDQPSCVTASCQWDAVSSTCTGNEEATNGLTETAVVQLYTDGSAAAPLFMGGQTQYRYDPNGLFTEVEIGTALPSAGYGLAYDPVTRVAVFPHAYLFKASDGSGPAQCITAKNMLVWRQGASLGQLDGSGVGVIGTPVANTTNISDTIIKDVYGFPKLAARDNGSVRFTFGHGTDGTYDLTTEGSPCLTADGTSFAAGAFGSNPIFNSDVNSQPLVAQTPMPLFIGESGTGGALTSTDLEAPTNKHPCRGNGDCGGGQTCSANTCTGSFHIEGYLPQPISKGDALAYSHVSCGTGYGSACGRNISEYDLVLSRVLSDATATKIAQTFSLTNMTFVSAVPGDKELEAYIPGDIFSPLTRIYYLVSRDQDVTVNVSDSGTDGTTTATLPVYSLHWRKLFWDSSAGWSVEPAADLTGNIAISGNLQTATGPGLSCPLDGVANRIVKTTVTIANPIQFSFSPDGNYLAFTNITVATACASSPTGAGGVLAASSISGATLQVMDLTQINPQAQALYPPSCASQFNLGGEVQLMPTWIAGGAQIVFNSAPPQAANGVLVNNRFFRMNTADIGAADCRLVEISPSTAATAALANISTSIAPLGLTLVDTRTGQFACIGCVGAGAEGASLFAIAAVAALWRARRRSRAA